jgi:hypothetical protein
VLDFAYTKSEACVSKEACLFATEQKNGRFLLSLLPLKLGLYYEK